MRHSHGAYSKLILRFLTRLAIAAYHRITRHIKIDKLEFVQRFFTRKLSGLNELSYFSRLKIAWFRNVGMSPTNLRAGAIL